MIRNSIVSIAETTVSHHCRGAAVEIGNSNKTRPGTHHRDTLPRPHRPRGERQDQYISLQCNTSPTTHLGTLLRLQGTLSARFERDKERKDAREQEQRGCDVQWRGATSVNADNGRHCTEYAVKSSSDTVSGASMRSGKDFRGDAVENSLFEMMVAPILRVAQKRKSKIENSPRSTTSRKKEKMPKHREDRQRKMISVVSSWSSSSSKHGILPKEAAGAVMYSHT